MARMDHITMRELSTYFEMFLFLYFVTVVFRKLDNLPKTVKAVCINFFQIKTMEISGIYSNPSALPIIKL